MIGGAKGIGLGLDFGIGNQLRPRNGKPYIEQAVLDSLCGVWIADQNTNESSTRKTIKNKLKDRGGDFKILNVAFKDNSGYGKYNANFTTWSKAPNNKLKYTYRSFKIQSINDFNSYGYVIWRTAQQSNFKIKVYGFPIGKTMYYTYFTVSGQQRLPIKEDGIYELPSSLENTSIGFGFNVNAGLDESFIGLTIEQIPDYQGSFVTDGVDDLIVSEKSVSDMLGGSNEITVISMIHQITFNSNFGNKAFTNYILKSDSSSYIKNIVTDIDKTGIYGYTYDVSKNVGESITNILGDKNDYILENSITYPPSFNNSEFSVVGKTKTNAETSQIAWYWTVIANKVLTEDQINQVIEYFNLDKYVKPDVLYNVKKQGITNDNHAQFGDKLIDYSGNGRDMQLYNIGWKEDSGIGKYPFDFMSLVRTSRINDVYPNRFTYDDKNTAYYLIYRDINNKIDVPSFKITVKNISATLIYFYITSTGDKKNIFFYEDGTYEVPTSYNSLYTGSSEYLSGFASNGGVGYVELVPEYENALVLDGVNDYGKVDNMPIYKDYTVVVDREILRTNKSGCSISKNNPGAFLMELGAATASSNDMASYSFGLNKILIVNNKRQFSYQSKYLYNGEGINVGTEKDTKDMWLGTVRDNDARFGNLAFYSALLFPYSLSKFLIERQLKRHKLGSFYEGMILFRPEISSNVPYESIEFYYETRSGTKEKLLPGDYFTLQGESAIAAYIRPYGADEPRSITVNEETYNLRSYGDGTYHAQIFPTKFPQKIDITIEEYIRFEDIVQPYPAFFEFIDENGNLFSWGGKARIGSTITITKGISSPNLLPDMYDITALELNGVPLSTLELTVSEFMGFSCIPVWKLDNNEPKLILSPEKLNMPNSAYEALGYIPDISGNGNHGYIYNSAYNENSGMNEDGSFKLDGVDDYIKLENLYTGGQQVFMKCKWSKATSLLYDQRSQLESDFAILTTAKDEGVDNDRIAYNARNRNGYSYIDGIWNQYVETYTLQDVIHNITITNDEYTDSQSPVIGKGTYRDNYAGMSLYTFMLFDEISTDDEISYLNTIVGVEPKIEFPPYYYDNHGRSNLDENKVTLDNLGTGGVHPLVAQNIAFEEMSGYGGYSFKDFSKWGIDNSNVSIVPDTETPYHVDVTNYTDTNQWAWRIYVDMADIAPGDLGKIKLMCDKDTTFVVDLKYRKSGDTVDNTLPVLSHKIFANTPTDVTWNYKTQVELDELGAVGHYWYLVYFWLNKDVTYSIDMLPEYPNAILLDGVNDTLRNTTIPALTDFTCIVKREEFGEQLSSSVFAYKGGSNNLLTEEKAFMYNYKNNNGVFIFSFDKYNNLDPVTPISYITPISADGRTIVKGTGKDTIGLTIGKWSTCWKGAFYKMLLWDKTLDNLSINMIKNLIEEDNVIDTNNPIFKK